jgi:hypothetical protein
MMESFAIDIRPPLPPVRRTRTPIPRDGSLCSSFDYYKVMAVHPEQYELHYRIGDRDIAYSPGSIATLLIDLLQEWEGTKRRKDHVLDIQGYSLAEVRFADDVVSFCNPGQDNPFCSGMSVGDIERELETKAHEVWSVVLAASRKKSWTPDPPRPRGRVFRTQPAPGVTVPDWRAKARPTK